MMNGERTSAAQDESSDGSLGQLAGLVASQLLKPNFDAHRQTVLASNVLDRVRRSALAHRCFVTVRREDGHLDTLEPGQLTRSLRRSGGVRVDLVQLAPDTPLYWPDEVHGQEVLVLDGSLVDSQLAVTSQHELILRDGPDFALTSGPQGAHLYVRQVIDPSSLAANETAWWRGCEKDCSFEWQPLSEGVEVKNLRQNGNVVSMLARVAPGLPVLDHGHALDEDCMMLSGDLFLGDILMRQGDYQMAPKGEIHSNSMSESGALFYFHGAMPGSD